MANAGRKLRRLQEKEARRKDGKQRSFLAEKVGRGQMVYRAGQRVKKG